MKSKCSFILKALTAMVLVVILLFGTVATSLAAVVKDDLTDTGAKVDLTKSGTGSFTGGMYVYLIPGTNWYSYGANFSVYAYNSNDDNAWGVSVASGADKDTPIRIVIPGASNKTWSNIIFIRTGKTVGQTLTGWDDKYNQSGDISYSSDANCFHNPDNWWDSNTTMEDYCPPLAAANATFTPASSTIYAGESVTFSSSVTDTYVEHKSDSLTSSPAASVAGMSVTFATQGDYTVTDTITYNAKGFPDVTATIDKTASVTVNPPLCTPVIKDSAGTAELANTAIYAQQTISFKTVDPSSHSATYSVHKDGSDTDTASTYLDTYSNVANNGIVTFNPNGATGSFVISSTCSGGGTDSVTITVNDLPSVEFKHSTTKNDVSYGGTAGQIFMTYDSAASTKLGGKDSHVVMKATVTNLSSTADHHWVIWNGSQNRYYATTINSNSGAVTLANGNAGTGYDTIAHTNDNAGIIRPSYTGDTYVYYDLLTDKVYVELPIRVIYKYTKDRSNSTQKATADIPYNTTTTTKDCSVTGYTPKSGNTWYEEVGCTNSFDFTTKLREDKTLYTPLTAEQYTVTLDAGTNGGTISGGATTTFTHTYDTASDLSGYTPVAPTGYTFDGWYDSSNNKQTAVGATAITADATYTARYDEITGNAVAKAFTNGSESGTGGKVYVGSDASNTYASVLLSGIGITSPNTLHAVAETGYTFTGWEKTGDNRSHLKLYINNNFSTEYSAGNNNPVYVKTDGASGLTEENAIIKALFTANTYTVTLSDNASSGITTAGSTSVTATYNAAMPGGLTLPVRTGYTFQGYYDTAAATGGTKYYNADGSSANNWTTANNTTTLYARWSEVTVSPTVKAYTDGEASFTGGTVKVDTGSAGASDTVSNIGVATSKKLTAAANTGYTFTGWTLSGTNSDHIQLYTDSDCTNAYTPGAATPEVYVKTDGNGSITASDEIRANYTALTYTVTYEAVYTDDGSAYSAVDATHGGTFSGSNLREGASNYRYNDHITFTATAYAATDIKGYYVEKIEVSTDGGSTWGPVGTSPAAAPLDYTHTTMANTDYTLNNESVSSYTFKAYFKAYYFVTAYSSWVYDDTLNGGEGGYVKVAAPPKTVTVGSETAGVFTADRTYTYAVSKNAADLGEDTIIYQSGLQGNIANPTGVTEHIVYSDGSYHEGNKLLVYAGEVVHLNYSNLSTSEAICSVFFNNDIRFTTEEEADDLFKDREFYPDGYDGEDYSDDMFGTNVWPNDYKPATTLCAVENFFDPGSTAYTTIQGSTYAGHFNQETHTVSWTATQSYLNVSIELAQKMEVIVNDGSLDGIGISGLNDEGFYVPTETVGTNIDDHTGGFVITLDPTGKNCSYKFNTLADNVTIIGADTGTDYKANSTFAIKAYDSSDVEVTTGDGSDIDHYVVTGTMPNENVNITVGVQKYYLLKLNNAVLCDTIDNKKFLNQTDGTSYTDGATAESNATGHIGTVTAYVNNDSTHDIAYEDSSTYHWYYPGGSGGTAGIYENNAQSHNYYLKRGGVNTAGSYVTAGSSVTYKFTFAEGMDGAYSFIGWFGGDENGYDPGNLLGYNETLTKTFTKNTYVWAVGTRDLYIRGDFVINDTTKNADYDSTNGWATSYKMDYDAEYENEDGSVKGRYKYTFNSVTKDYYYHFLFLDNASSGYTVWNSFQGQINANVADNAAAEDVGTRWGRNATSGTDSDNNGYFAWRTVDQDAGFECPVTIYFYPSATTNAKKLSVEADYQWSTAYVSAGVGIDIQNYPEAAEGAAAVFNEPSVTVGAQTVNEQTVNITDDTFGSEAIKVCKVEEKDGKIIVTADPEDTNLEVQAFVIYNVDTKRSVAVLAKDFDRVDPTTHAATAHIDIPKQSKLYIVPIYKFTSDYISSPGGGLDHLEDHTVYVRTSDVDMDSWGGLVAMYSWGPGTTSSGDWPGQLLIPAGDSFYGQLTFAAGALRGVTISNYRSVDGSGNATNFVGTYVSKGVSSTPYTTTGHETIQTYDYREPISIIENINAHRYEDEDMAMTFALKDGDKGDAVVGTSAFSSSYDFDYLTDASGVNRVDLNGHVTTGTASYYIVCSYTEDYSKHIDNNVENDYIKTYDFAPDTRNQYSIDWYVYEAGNTTTPIVSGLLSAAYADMTHESDSWLTVIANAVADMGAPVSGKAVKIAYENSRDYGNVIRYSGQWYSEGTNTLINVHAKVGVLSNGSYILTDNESNNAGYGTATISAKDIYGNDVTAAANAKGEYLIEKYSAGYSDAVVTKKNATDNKVTLTATNDNGKFIGWYYQDKEGNYKQVKQGDTSTVINPTITEETTYVAFYRASESYVIKYKGREDKADNDSQWHTYSVTGADLSAEELANNGILTPDQITARSSDITSKLAGFSNVKVFGRTTGINFGTATPVATAYTLTYTIPPVDETYNLKVYWYGSNGLLTQNDTASGSWNTPIDVTSDVGSYTPKTTYKPTGHEDYVFIGWAEYDERTAPTVASPIISTQHNFGYSITKDMTIAPVFGTPDQRSAIYDGTWSANIDENVITQELTGSDTGYIYNDNLLGFRYSSDTRTPLDRTGAKECGVIIMAQTGASVTEFGGAFTDIEDANYLSDDNMKAYAKLLVQRSLDSAKLASAKFGNAYAFRVKARDLSTLNRVDIAQKLDYKLFSGGNYKVIAYYYFGGDSAEDKSNAANYVFSSVITGTYTVS